LSEQEGGKRKARTSARYRVDELKVHTFSNPPPLPSHLRRLPEETHPDVVPELRRVRSLHGRNSVLHERHVHVLVVLNDAAGSEDGLGIERVVGEGVAEVLERLLVLA